MYHTYLRCGLRKNSFYCIRKAVEIVGAGYYSMSFHTVGFDIDQDAHLERAAFSFAILWLLL